MHSACGTFEFFRSYLFLFFHNKLQTGTTLTNVTHRFTRQIGLEINVGLGKAPANGVKHPTSSAEHTSPSQKENCEHAKMAQAASNTRARAPSVVWERSAHVPRKDRRKAQAQSEPLNIKAPTCQCLKCARLGFAYHKTHT